MKVRNYEIFEMQAEMIKMLAHPKRLMLLELLSEGETSVGDLAKGMETPAATVSQHLRLLRDRHLVTTRREGQTIYYSLVDDRITKACHISRDMLLDNIKRRSELAGSTAT
jgi:ArsR family transcriptional regulator